MVVSILQCTTVFLLLLCTGSSQLVVISEDTSNFIYSTVQLTCVAHGMMFGTSISWERNDSFVHRSWSDSEVEIIEENFTENNFNFTLSTVVLCSVEPEDAGLYACIVSNDETSLFDILTVELVVIDNRVAAQIIASTTRNTITDECTTPLLICVGVGNPKSTIIWEKNGNSLLNNSEVLIHEYHMTRNGYVLTESILQLCSVQFDSTGNYSCVASNEGGTNLEIIELIVNVTHDPPEIVSLTQSVAAEIGETIVLTCVATGFPSPEIRWKNNDIVISNDSTVTITENQFENGGIRSSVTFLSLQLNDTGQYTCTAISDCFTTSLSTTITVFVLPEILVVTENVTATVDTTILLSCVTYGIPSAIIEWLFNGSIITNDSTNTSSIQQGGLDFTQSTLTLCGIQPNSTGLYVCCASNAIIQAPINATVELVVLENEDCNYNIDLCSLLFCDPNAECNQLQDNTTFTCTCKAPDYFGDGFNCSKIGFFQKHKTPILSAVCTTAVLAIIMLLGALYGYIYVGKKLGLSIRALRSAKENSNESNLLIDGDNAKE